jgi:hypothetical protein
MMLRRCGPAAALARSMVRRRWGLSVALACGVGHAACAQTRGLEVTVQHDVRVPMRDGVHLSTELFRPSGPGTSPDARYPVLLLRTPYAIDDSVLVRQARTFAAAGYVVALQNLRGRYRSEGVFTKYADVDAPDGYDAIEWLAAQRWSTGKVGMWGRSYAAHAQADAAKTLPPHLAALLINQGGMADGWDHAVRHGGAFELGREMTWAFQEARRDAVDIVARAALDSARVEDWYTALPLRRGQSPLRVMPEYEAYLLDEWTTADDGPYWARSSLRWRTRYGTTADVPMLHVGGWYDIFLRGTLMNVEGLSRGRRGPVRALIGPWVHGGNARSVAGEVEFGADAAIRDFDTEFHLRWFDHWLKGVDNGVERDPPLRLFVMGGGDGQRNSSGRLQHGGRWIDADTFPLRGTTSRRFYLHADGRLSPDAPRSASAALTFRFDPAHPVPTLGGNVSNRVRDGAYDQRERPDFVASRAPFLPLRARADVLVFETPPLEDDVTVIGPIDVVLHVSTTGLDTDFTAKLVDVYPPSQSYPTGFDLNIMDGVQRLSYRNGRRTRALARPGQVYPLRFRLFPTANRFVRGHRIRIDISSSNFPRFDVNPNTGEPLGQHRRMQVVDNTVYLSATRPSYVVLPIAPAAALR